MSWKPNSKWTAALVAAAALLALPAAAQATLVFTRHTLNPLIWSAKDNGSHAQPLVHGTNPRLSPDGKTIAFYRIQKAHGYRAELVVVAADGGGTTHLLLPNWSEPFVFDWSPDSSTVAAVAGSFGHSQRLVLIDVATGARRTVAKGFFGGVSFEPEGKQLVFSKAGSEKYPPRADVYRFDLSSGKTARLTHDSRSEDPLWGPNGQIVFDKLLGEKSRQFGPKSELYLMNAKGGQVKRLTHTKVDPLLSGLSPTQWSASGNQLLTEFGGQDTTYAVTVNPHTGAQQPLTKERETGFVGTALSSDGKLVLGSIGGFEPGPGHRVVSIPYAGGKPKMLAANASEPDWSR
jgi:Tol biopolymer transport system component